MWYLITNYTFVPSLHFMLDLVGACAGMSQIMQLKRRCVALGDLSLHKCVEVLERAERWEGLGWTSFQKDSKKTPPQGPKKICADRMVDAMGQSSKKKIARPPKNKKKRGRTKRSQKKSEEAPSTKYPCSFPNPHPTPFSPFPFLECTKISAAQLVVFLRDGTHF